MSYETRLNDALELAFWVQEATNDTNPSVSKREQMSLALLQQVLDVDDGIILLLQHRLPGPALALARPRFEGYVRAIWLQYCASDDQLDDFEKGRCPNFPALISAIGDDVETGGAWIKANADANMKDFHDLTHGGISHILRRIGPNAIEPNYPEAELESLLTFGIEIKIRCAVELLAQLGEEEKLEELNQRAAVLRSPA